MNDLTDALEAIRAWEELSAQRRGPNPSFAALDAPKQALSVLENCAQVRGWLDEVERFAVCDSQLCGAPPDEVAGALGLRSVEELIERWPGCIIRVTS